MEKEKKILVVDDDATVLEMILEGLTDNNFDVIASNNPTDALDKIENEVLSYALIDLDLGWKYTNGIELGQQLNSKFEDIIVIIMTGYHNLKFAVEAMRKHSFHYLIKPFRIDQVVSLIERADRERILINENKNLKQAVGELEDENERLNNLIKEMETEEQGRVSTHRDKSRNRTINNSTALRSYQRQKNAEIPAEKNNNVSTISDD